jgi:hypothetical protein
MGSSSPMIVGHPHETLGGSERLPCSSNSSIFFSCALYLHASAAVNCDTRRRKVAPPACGNPPRPDRSPDHNSGRSGRWPIANSTACPTPIRLTGGYAKPARPSNSVWVCQECCRVCRMGPARSHGTGGNWPRACRAAKLNYKVGGVAVRPLTHNNAEYSIGGARVRKLGEGF